MTNGATESARLPTCFYRRLTNSQSDVIVSYTVKLVYRQAGSRIPSQSSISLLFAAATYDKISLQSQAQTRR